MLPSNHYLITFDGETREYELAAVRKSGAVVLVDLETKQEKGFTGAQFSALLSSNLAIAHEPNNSCARLERLSMMAPDSLRRLREMGWLNDAKTTLFFAQKFDHEGWCAKSDAGLEGLVMKHKAEAKARGLSWTPVMHRRGEEREWPSPSSLRRALACGEPHKRTLAKIYETYGLRSRANRWDPFLLDLSERVIEKFWSEAHVNVKIATAMFMRPALAEKRRRHEEYGVDMDVPDPETFRRWIRESISRERIAKKYGAKAARQLCDGYTIGMQALRPLHIVQVDHTPADQKILIRNRFGKIIAKKRAWFVGIVDVFSRSFLAALLSFEPPSLASLASAVKQMIRPKTFLLEDFYGGPEWAVDIHGKPSIVVLDNGLEAMRGSFQLSCDMSGIEMDVAPLGTPPYKAIIERAIDATNQALWHLAPGAIPFKPHVLAQQEITPDLSAEWTLDLANKMLWKSITEQRHQDVSGPIKMPPALKWMDGKEEDGRTLGSLEIDFIDCAFGQRKQDVTLTNGGARVNGFVFGDGAEVTGLLEDLLAASNHKFRRGKVPAKGKAKIDVVWYADDCSYVSAYNPRRHRYVRLKNRDPMYRDHPCSWNLAKAIDKYFEARNEKFESAEDRYARIVEYADHLERTIVGPKKPETRNDYRKYEQLKRSTLLGGEVEYVSADPTPNGMAKADIPVVMPGRELRGDVQVSKRPRAGGKAATAKGMETKRRNNASAQGSAFQDRPQKQGPIIEGTVLRRAVVDEVTDFNAFMDSIINDLD